MSTERSIEDMRKTPHCAFCEHSYFDLFKMRCNKCGNKICKATECKYYSPTKTPIEHRRCKRNG